MFQKIRNLWNDLCASQDGGVAMYVGLAFMVIIGGVGISIDAGRGYVVQSKLSSALDAAGLAAASTVSTTNLQTDARRYLDVNFQNYMGSEVTDFQVIPNDSNTVITLSATAQLPTSFMGLFGHDTMTVATSSEITRAISGLELALVLDVTGSMAGTPLSDLKTAAQDLIDILFGANTTNDKLWVGVVPFAQAVNVGNTRTDWLDSTYAGTLNWGPTSWMGCVDERTGGDDVTDKTPASKKFRPYYYPSRTGNVWIDKGKYVTPLNATQRGPNLYCSPAVLPLTANKEAIENKILSLTAVGGTHVNIGAVWGWRMLSPNWRGTWGGDMNANDLPLDYNTPKMNKAVIIMTDGENTMYEDNTNRSAFDLLSKGNLGTTNVTTAKNELDKRLSQVCTSMKTNNIIVYTIAFRSPGSTIQTLLRNCASMPEYYFDSPSGSELQTAFRAIGDSLSNLRVSR